MRREYEKPQIMVEKFSLTEAVASCDVSVNLTTDGGCSKNDGGVDNWAASFPGIFSGGCANSPDADTSYGEYCYFTSSGTSVFSS